MPPTPPVTSATRFFLFIGSGYPKKTPGLWPGVRTFIQIFGICDKGGGDGCPIYFFDRVPWVRTLASPYAATLRAALLNVSNAAVVAAIEDLNAAAKMSPPAGADFAAWSTLSETDCWKVLMFSSASLPSSLCASEATS